MSRVFVRIHWCWRCVAVPMAPGTGHGPLSVWKIVARLLLLFGFVPFAVVPKGGHLRGIVLAYNAWRNEFNKRQRRNRSKNSKGSYTRHVKTQQISFKQHLFCSTWYNEAFVLLCFVGKVKTHFLLHSI
jgi:hypothetical protein